MNQESTLKEDKITPVVVDLNAVKAGKVNEGGFLRMFGWAVETILNKMFSGGTIPVSVKGSPSQVKSFAHTLGSEKRYLDSWKRFGLDDPRTYKNKAELNRAIVKFERLTGLSWPFD